MNKLKFPLLISQDSFYFTLGEENNRLCYNEQDIIDTFKRFEEDTIDISFTVEENLNFKFRYDWVNYYELNDPDSFEFTEVRWEYIETTNLPKSLNELLTLEVTKDVYELYIQHHCYIKDDIKIYSLDGFNWVKLKIIHND